MRRGTWSRVFGRGVDFLQKRKGLSIFDPRHDPRADQSCYKKWGLPGARARVKSAKVPYVYCTRTTPGCYGTTLRRKSKCVMSKTKQIPREDRGREDKDQVEQQLHTTRLKTKKEALHYH